VDTIKTQYQRNALFRRAGVQVEKAVVTWLSRELYRGLPITLFRVVVGNGIQMGIFESLKTKIRRMDVNPPKPEKEGSDGPFRE
jgi:hypothetical protein